MPKSSKKSGKYAGRAGSRRTAKVLLRVFLDTSALVSGLNSTTGASGVILLLFKFRKISLLVSEEVIIEANRVIQSKLPLLQAEFQNFLRGAPEIAPRITPRDIRRALAILDSEDTDILAVALKSKADFLITLDKSFLAHIVNKTAVRAAYPGEFLAWYRATYINL